MRRYALGLATIFVASLATTGSLVAGCGSYSPQDCASRGDCPGDDAGADADAISPVDVIVVSDAGNVDAGDGAADTGPTCIAPRSLSCPGGCVDPTLPAHCGTCDNVCSGPDGGEGHGTCSNGVCGVSCDPDGSAPLDCNGACVDPTQPAHCGSCSNACPPPPSGNGTATCTSPMVCRISCSPGYHVCGADCMADSDVPSTTTDPCVISDAFGVFVSPAGSDTAAGTMAAPVKTIGHAMDLAKAASKRVYACGSAGPYASENLTVGTSRDGVKANGGLDCSAAQWTYSASKLAVVAPTAAGYALQVTGLTTGVTFEDFGFESQNASGAGASSVAVFVSGSSNVVLRRCTVQAGTGSQGQDQSQPAPYGSSAPSGNPGGSSVSAGGSGAGGGAQANPQCPTSIGGAGGSAKAGQLDGQTGQPGANNAGTSAACGGVPSAGGGTGANGGPGGGGPGASTWAVFSSSGWNPSGGGQGLGGSVGQGGGGGGAVAAASTLGGAGGGGAGGCGGAGGPAGSGGGSSIAVLVYQSAIDLESCTLRAAKAGRGGNGAAGQTGQSGGGPGGGGTASCDGGQGGQGGNGGPGGGGAGGLSAGVVWSGAAAMAPTVNGSSVPSAATLMNVTIGALGPGGADGAGNNSGAGSGRPGAAQAVVQFQ